MRFCAILCYEYFTAPGVCPDFEAPSECPEDNGDDECSTDESCEVGMKCCDTGCYLECVSKCRLRL